MSRNEILSLLQKTLEGHGLIGGRRRRHSMSGHGDMMSMYDMPMSRYGHGLIGGRRKSRTRTKSKSRTRSRSKVGGRSKSKSKKMTEATKRYLKAYHKKHPRKKRGRGLIGGSPQEFYNELVDEFMRKHPEANIATAENEAARILDESKSMLKLGVTPSRTKDQLIRTIRSTQRRLGFPESVTTHLRSMTKDRLQRLLNSLERDKDIYRTPTNRERFDAEDEDLLDGQDYGYFDDWTPEAVAAQVVQEEE